MDDQAAAVPDGELWRLGRAECMLLLAGAQVGRLIFTVNALPVVRPMNYALAPADGLVVVRTASGTTTARKVGGQIVAFEVDELDEVTCSGWSVTVTGRAALVTSPEAIARYSALPLVPWAPGVRDQFVTISTEVVEGQRVGPRPPAMYGMPAVPAT